MEQTLLKLNIPLLFPQTYCHNTAQYNGMETIIWSFIYGISLGTKLFIVNLR